MTIINNNLAVILAKKLLKIKTVSKETGISRTTLTSLYYQRSSRISFDVLNRLCQYFGCTVGELIEYRKEEGPNEKL